MESCMPDRTVRQAINSSHSMNPTHLHQIAVEAIRSRGLLPVFSPQALQEAEAARQAGPERDGNIRDLDQLSVAQSCVRGY